ncbi:mycothiol conjugate amidase Mca [Dactylosporangium matsuzakiense]|uniref:Mycothiol S-conjugate amidase n=1 Tax=Dactylosporangium matsuzakiense TaxID=53360 RepID=A0A9W6NNI7_9ACTN|nr:mycothiol conjugate amidase Mca [Dactylosporangium matsuzakiense]UWZ44199.1 mycothiol conjugate amidase Mca [Dactylosporangium matsuzakiense]GLL03356.1 mycothiol S-conjugate amidase [Dactylosporangium matsuzakiense]
MTEQLRLMAVHAHPDDESSKGAAAMAMYSAEGVDVLVVTCTGGERGSVLNPKLDRPEIWENIAEIRRAEMDRAREILGIRQAWLGFVDSGLPEGDPLPPLPDGCFGLMDPEVAAEPLVKLIREFKPHVITTYDENGGYPHPDHVMTHKISMVAFEAAADADRYPDAGEPWQPLKLYYNMGWSFKRMTLFHEAMLELTGESPYTEWLKEMQERRTAREGQPEWPDPDKRVTTKVPCGDFFEARDDALRAHATQVDPDGFWFAVPLNLQQKIWPTEDFELVKSFVETSMPEDDLFAGVR